MKKNRLIFLLVLMLYFLCPLVAGGKKEAVQIKGKLTIWADDTRTKIFRDIGKEFKEETGIDVEVTEMLLDDIREQAIIMAPTGKGPDILVGAHDWIGKLVVNGTISEIKLPKETIDKFDAVTIEAMSYGGNLYGIPYAREGVALIYNKKLVPKPPESWEELLIIARKLTDPKKPQYGFIYEHPFPYNGFPILSSQGKGYIFGKNPDGTLNICDIGIEGFVEGAEIYDSLIEEGILPPEVSWETMTGLLSHGQAGMVISGPWAIPIAKSADINVGVIPLPTINGGTPRPFVGVPGIMVSTFSNNQALIREFIDHFVTKETMLLMFHADPRIPAYLPAYEEVSDDPILKAFAESIEKGIPLPNVPEMRKTWTIWADAMAMIASQKMEPLEALRQATEQIKKELECK